MKYISKIFSTDLRLFELTVLLHAFGQALVSVFIPIFLFKLGFSLSEILGFYILWNFIDVPLNLLAGKLIQIKGARFTVLLGLFCQVGYFIILYNLHHSLWMLLSLAVVMAMFDAFYWVGHLYIFASAAHKSKTIRTQVGFLKVIRLLGALTAPLIGAWVLGVSDQRTLIFFSTIVVFASLLPLFKMRHLKFIPETADLSPKSFFKARPEKINYSFTAIQAVIEEVETVILPFFIFYSFSNLKSVALVPVLIASAELVLSYWVGRLSLKKNIAKLISLGSFAIAIIWIARLQFLDNLGLLLFSVFAVALLLIFIIVPIEVSIFQRSQETDVLAAVTYMNLVRMLARGVLYVVLFLLGTYFNGAFYIVILLLLSMSFCARMLELKRS